MSRDEANSLIAVMRELIQLNKDLQATILAGNGKVSPFIRARLY